MIDDVICNVPRIRDLLVLLIKFTDTMVLTWYTAARHRSQQIEKNKKIQSVV